MLKEKLPPSVQHLLELHNPNDPTAFWGSREMYILFGTIFFIAALFFIWARYFRMPRSHASDVLSSSKRIHRDSRDRRDKKQKRWKKRNPTLAETGGLPPPKTGPASK